MLCLTQKWTEWNYSQQLKQIEEKLKQAPTNHGSIIKNKQKAIQKRAKTLHEEFLKSLLTTAKNTKDKSKQWLIYHLCQAELNWQCFAAVKSVLKPQSPRGIDTPPGPRWQQPKCMQNDQWCWWNQKTPAWILPKTLCYSSWIPIHHPTSIYSTKIW